MSADEFFSKGKVRDLDVISRLRRRLMVSVGTVAVWLSLLLLYFGFWAAHYSWFQDTIVVLVSVIGVVAVLAGTWISFGLGFAEYWPD